MQVKLFVFTTQLGSLTCPVIGIELVSGEPAVKEYILPDDVLEVSTQFGCNASAETEFYIHQQLDGVARRCVAKTGCSPCLLVVVLPNRGSGITYTRIKQ